MTRVSHLVLLALLGCGGAAVFAAEPAGPTTKSAPGRELLQPPKVSIASPITDRLAMRGIFYSPRISTQMRGE